MAEALVAEGLEADRQTDQSQGLEAVLVDLVMILAAGPNPEDATEVRIDSDHAVGPSQKTGVDKGKSRAQQIFARFTPSFSQDFSF